MPSKNTKVLTVRVKNETYDRLVIGAESMGLSLAKYLDLISENQSETEPEFDFDSLIEAFRKRKYPDSAIRRSLEQICEQIKEAGDYRKGVW